MPTNVQELDVFRPALRRNCFLSGLVVLCLLFDGATQLVPPSLVSATMDRMGCASSEPLARAMGAITVICTLLYALPPTSFVGAILLSGYLGGAIASHLHVGSPLSADVLFGLCPGLMVLAALWLRDEAVAAAALIPSRRGEGAFKMVARSIAAHHGWTAMVAAGLVGHATRTSARHGWGSSKRHALEGRDQARFLQIVRGHKTAEFTMLPQGGATQLN